jgi:small subunit ribosomal protein S17
MNKTEKTIGAAKKVPTTRAAVAKEDPKVAVGQAAKRQLTGLVVSDKMTKTIVVQVDRRVKHAFYAKYVTRTQRYKAHDENGSAKMGDLVQISESRPLSKDKRWTLLKILRKAPQLAEANV